MMSVHALKASAAAAARNAAADNQFADSVGSEDVERQLSKANSLLATAVYGLAAL